jgi:hypothetical protein
VDYNANNDTKGLTDLAMEILASACPRLQHVELKATQHLTDASLRAFLKSCPKLTHPETSAASRHSLALAGTAFATLFAKPDWVPKLRTLRVAHSSHRGFMKAMRELSKERKTLTIEHVKTLEEKETRN